MDWLKQSWGYLILGGGFLAAVIVAVRNAYAAERDRKALQLSDLERQKLELEVARLRNSPEVVTDRRAIYDKLRQEVHQIIHQGSLDISDLAALHELKHQSEYRFPPDVVAAIGELIESAVQLYWSNKELQRGPQQVGSEWKNVVQSNSNALLDIVAFQQTMVDRFRPYLTL